MSREQDLKHFMEAFIGEYRDTGQWQEMTKQEQEQLLIDGVDSFEALELSTKNTLRAILLALS